ncbi:polysaccharide pyruvyl transferase family protein [Streptomyces sp. NPDC006460]|uniref:polysaccharide pyruvyl transferase family protein n=1 Tax=Streptomyces sp. NPDC006460 TaxID=3154304 RepID=UPI0033BF80AE
MNDRHPEVLSEGTDASSSPRPPRILLRSSWQTANIGDIAHTPGILALLEKWIPDAEVTLWASALGPGPAVRNMLRDRFPGLRILNDPPEAEEATAAIADHDFFLHSSGPRLMGAPELRSWRETGKPYGVYGITFWDSDEATLELLNGAEFVYFRDSVSLNKAVLEVGLDAPVVDFTPDAAFAADVLDDEAAAAFLKESGLEEGKFLCCLGRWRYTPWWEMYPRPMTDHDRKVQAYNEHMVDADHAPLRAAIEEVVRHTDLKVLLCPEDRTQMKVLRAQVHDKLPEDVRGRVVLRDTFWLTNEALSVYTRSAGLFSNEMHSPIMAIGRGIPAIVCRWSEQTSKGFMWRDIGLGDWLFDHDYEESRSGIAPAVLEMAQDPDGARAKAAAARDTVQRHHEETMKLLADLLRNRK